jgi:hypothetical protein
MRVRHAYPNARGGTAPDGGFAAARAPRFAHRPAPSANRPR